MLTSDLIAQGRILWLTDPFKDEDSEDSDGRPYDLPETFNGIELGILGHPVMVLHTLEGKTDVALVIKCKLQLTTLNGRGLEDRKYTYQYQYNHQFYLAVYPMEPPCLFLYPQLRLVNNIQLRKPGYLCIKKRYTVPLSMLEAYDAKFSATRYNLTPESFAIVANTFGVKIPTPVEAAATETAEIIHETPDRTQSLPESKVATTASEPELGSERPPLVKIKLSAKPQSEPECDSKTTPTPPIPANPSSTYTKFVVGKTARDHARLLLSSGNFKKLVAAAFAVDATTAIEQVREVINARKTRSTKTEHKKPFGISDILG